MADTLLKVDNINVYYGNIHAVKDISFEVDQGEIVTLIGANGAGKSTTLENHFRPFEAPHRRCSVQGQEHQGRARPQDRGKRSCTGTGGPPCVPAHDGGREP